MRVLVDSTAIKHHSDILKEMHRSAFPNAVRETLNKLAFDVKQNTMPDESKVFIHRNITFFKATSKVEPAKGWDVNKMEATVGFVAKPNDKSHSVEDLEQQEDGGSIAGRAFVPLAAARTNNSWGENVRKKNRLEDIRKEIVDPRKSMITRKSGNTANGRTGRGRGNVRGQQFIKAAIYAGKGGFVMNDEHTRLMEIKAIKRVGRMTVIKSTVVETIEKERHIHPHATHFMRKAAMESIKKADAFFAAAADKQIKRLQKK